MCETNSTQVPNVSPSEKRKWALSYICFLLSLAQLSTLHSYTVQTNDVLNSMSNFTLKLEAEFLCPKTMCGTTILWSITLDLL